LFQILVVSWYLHFTR